VLLGIVCLATAPLTNERVHDAWALIILTCPVAAARSYFPLSLYLVLAANAATYALIGLVVKRCGGISALKIVCCNEG